MITGASRRRDYPVALAAGPEHGDRGIVDAVAWLMTQAKTVGGRPLVYAPQKSTVWDHAILGEFVNQPGIVLGTWKAGTTSGWGGGPVLAAWPDRVKLGEIADDPRTRALVVVPWAKGEIDAWIAAVDPQRLGPAPAAAARPDLDPVVVQGLTALTGMVNHANNLAGSLDRRDAVAVLRALKRAGYRLPPDDVLGWAMSHGWPARGAERLRELAAAFEAGRRPQMKGPNPLRADIIATWRAKAATDGTEN
ncbi:hypothetical protein AB0H36_27885 [Kribbella sp. NPDC050820]|uniref:hypothetical protein n=1 Tax=Kribbella sp. NPDC050820 TaxID=3155408 RepID=UPI0033E5C915